MRAMLKEHIVLSNKVEKMAGLITKAGRGTVRVATGNLWPPPILRTPAGHSVFRAISDVLAFAVVVITNTILSGVMILALRLIARLTS